MVAMISRNDVLALRAILSFYGSYLMNDKLPSVRRGREREILPVLVCKLSYAGSMVLTVEELALIKDALRVFISEVERRLPGSQERDGVLVSCEQLRRYIDDSFAV
jgi:hypothetical protein